MKKATLLIKEMKWSLGRLGTELHRLSTVAAGTGSSNRGQTALRCHTHQGATEKGPALTKRIYIGSMSCYILLKSKELLKTHQP